MSTRLTNDIREDIARSAVAHAFDARFATHKTGEDALAREAYETVFNADERKKANAIPENWLRRDNCLKFNVGGMTINLDMIGEGVPVPYKARGSEYGGYNCRALGVIEHGDLCDRIQKHAQQLETLKEERRAAQSALKRMLDAVTTTKRLKEVWPEGEQFFAKFDQEERPQLPALRVDEINAMLGLAA